MSQHLIFVYGTLKEGFPNFNHNTGTRVSGDFQTVEKFSLVLNGERFSPCMIDTQGVGHHVKGQLFMVDDEGLKKMDDLERIAQPDGYRRKTIEVRNLVSLSGQPQSVYVYLKKPEHVLDPRSEPLPEYSKELHVPLYRSRNDPVRTQSLLP